MPVNPAVEGRTYRMPQAHVVTRDEIVTFARAVRTSDDRCLDVDAARAAGHTDVVAPTTFAVTLAQQAEALFMRDEEAGVDFSRLVHGEATFTHHAPIVAGEALIAETTVARVRSAGGHDMVTLATAVTTADGSHRADTTSVVVIRAEEAHA